MAEEKIMNMTGIFVLALAIYVAKQITIDFRINTGR